MRYSLLPLLVIAFFSTRAIADLTLAHDGKTDYAIVLPERPSGPESRAAKELQAYMREVTGAEFQIRPAKEVGGDAAVIRVETNLQPADSIAIQTQGRQLVLAGGGSRGVLYAVYSFLEDNVGVRWWTSSESFVPKKGTLVVPELDVRYSPAIRYRECFNADVMRKNGVQGARLKLNGHHQNIPAEYGGHYSIIGWCHTSFSLISPSDFFTKHPDWYAADLKGRRNTTQLCWSNEEMRKELVKQVLKRIRKNPEAGMISVSQEDAGGYCQCDKCRAIAKEEGSEMGPLLRGVNAVAAEVGKEYPDFLVETLAYQWSRKPPRVTRPGKNVLIRLCSIEADFAHPLEGQDFGRDLREWSKIADHLFVWNYVTNFSNYLIPQPNWNSIGEDLKFFAENHVVGVFEQGDAYNNPVGDMLPMRVWVQAHLLWDPSRDQRALTKEFLDGYYGAAGAYLMEYLDLVNARSGEGNFRRGCYHHGPDFLTREGIARATELFDRAAGAVKGDAVLERRVAVQRLILDHVRLMRYDFAGELKAKPAGQVAKEYAAAADRFIAGARENGVKYFSEGLGFDAYPATLRAAGMVGVPVDLPKAGAKLAEGEYDIQEDEFYLYKRGDLADVVMDPKASNGKAARMRGGHTEWAVQFHVKKGAPYVGKGPWRCYVVARVEGAGVGHAFTVGAYENGTGMRGRRDVSMGEAGGGEYRAYGFVLDELKEGEYFWLSPGGGAVYVDRVFIQKESGRE